MNLGSHLSVSGGLYKALDQAAAYNFSSVAIFVRNQVQWKVTPLNDDAIERFKETRERLKIRNVVAHASYLINLAGKEEVRAKSIPAMISDVERCQQLNVEYLVLHPGSNPDLEKGIDMIAAGLNDIIKQTKNCNTRILLETTAGQGNCIGHQFEHIAAIIEKVKDSNRIGVCLDTCHIFAAGYDIRTTKTYKKTMKQFEDTIGFKNLFAIHLNDSKKDLGTRVDRHEHLSHGFIGKEAFVNLANDKRLIDIPFIMETPREKDGDGQDWDPINAAFFRSLVKE